jgi:hypothetical protein
LRGGRLKAVRWRHLSEQQAARSAALQFNAVLKLAAGDVIDVRTSTEFNDGITSAVKNSFYGHRIH